MTDERLKELLDTLNKVAEGQSEIHDAVEAARQAVDAFDRVTRALTDQQEQIAELTRQINAVLTVLHSHKRTLDALTDAVAPPPAQKKPKGELN